MIEKAGVLYFRFFVIFMYFFLLSWYKRKSTKKKKSRLRLPGYSGLIPG